MFESAEGAITEPVEGMFYTALTNETNDNGDTSESSNTTTTDSYDAETGVLTMPVVQVGSDYFEVEMIHLGDLVFQVTGRIAEEPVCDIKRLAGGIVQFDHIALRLVGVDQDFGYDNPFGEFRPTGSR